jgi:hypothetical protein
MIISKKILVLLIFILFILNPGFGEKIDVDKAKSYAAKFLAKSNSSFNTENLMNASEPFLFSENNEILAYIFDLEPRGFIVVSAFDVNNPVIGFSNEDTLPIDESLIDLPVHSIIRGIALGHKHAEAQVAPPQILKSSPDYEIYGPWVQTLWGQVNCHDNNGQIINVTNYYTPNNYAAGCVAISLATLLHYYQWPPVGTGFHEYYDGLGSSTGWYEANFGETNYKWDLMLEKYNNQESSDAQREAAGELAFQAAVALEMNFEYNGSTANVNEIPGTGNDYFRFYSYYKQENSTIFWPRLDKNIVEANPVILAVSSNTGYGHSVVCGGLWLTDDEERFYHLNMGWWGTGNGWFQIQEDFNAGGYTAIDGGVLDFIPKPFVHDAEILAGSDMFHLSWEFTQTIAADCYEVQRMINNGSWETITDDYQDTSILIVVDNLSDDLYFRVRAKVNGEWYPSTWSNTVQLQVITGIDETGNEETLSIFPNPFIHQLNILPSGNFSDASIRVYDMAGKVCYHTVVDKNSNGLTIPTQNWKPGIYMIEIDGAESQYHSKIIKK